MCNKINALLTSIEGDTYRYHFAIQVAVSGARVIPTKLKSGFPSKSPSKNKSFWTVTEGVNALNASAYK